MGRSLVAQVPPPCRVGHIFSSMRRDGGLENSLESMNASIMLMGIKGTCSAVRTARQDAHMLPPWGDASGWKHTSHRRPSAHTEHITTTKGTRVVKSHLKATLSWSHAFLISAAMLSTAGPLSEALLPSTRLYLVDVSFTRSLACEEPPDGVRCVHKHPSSICTEHMSTQGGSPVR
jgi:hypothetical protein